MRALNGNIQGVIVTVQELLARYFPLLTCRCTTSFPKSSNIIKTNIPIISSFQFQSPELAQIFWRRLKPHLTRFSSTLMRENKLLLYIILIFALIEYFSLLLHIICNLVDLITFSFAFTTASHFFFV